MAEDARVVRRNSGLSTLGYVHPDPSRLRATVDGGYDSVTGQVTGMALARASSINRRVVRDAHVLDKVVLGDVAGRLAAKLDREFLHEAEWDPRMRVCLWPRSIGC
jgi:hypothetical protein